MNATRLKTLHQVLSHSGEVNRQRKKDPQDLVYLLIKRIEFEVLDYTERLAVTPHWTGDDPLGLLKTWKAFDRQWPEHIAIVFFKHLLHLTFGRAMKTRVGDVS